MTTDVNTNPAEKRAERSHGAAGMSRASEGTEGEPADPQTDPIYPLPERVVWSLAHVVIISFSRIIKRAWKGQVTDPDSSTSELAEMFLEMGFVGTRVNTLHLG